MGSSTATPVSLASETNLEERGGAAVRRKGVGLIHGSSTPSDASVGWMKGYGFIQDFSLGENAAMPLS